MHAAHCWGMPIEGVDTFSCLCVPDLECTISGAADNNVVSHLGWPHAPCVAHQRPQTLRGRQKDCSLSVYTVHLLYVKKKRMTGQMKILCPFKVTAYSVILYLLLYWDITASWPFPSFYNCWLLSIEKERPIHSLCRGCWQLSSVRNSAHSSSLETVD